MSDEAQVKQYVSEIVTALSSYGGMYRNELERFIRAPWDVALFNAALKMAMKQGYVEKVRGRRFYRIARHETESEVAR